jgi:hypothetical protein
LSEDKEERLVDGASERVVVVVAVVVVAGRHLM